MPSTYASPDTLNRGRHRPAAPGRRGAGMTGVLTSALAGGSVVAGHVVLSQGGGPHVEDVALQSFGVTESAGPADLGVPERPRLEMSAVPAVAGPLVDAPPVDVSTIVRDATSALRVAGSPPPPPPAPPADPGARVGGSGPGACANGTDGFGSVDGGVAAAGEQLRCRFGVDTVYGVAGRSNASDHPAGKALDFMVDRATGERLAEFAVANRERLGISYVIYRQRIDTGDGWEPMDDRGGVTANHMDHVHVSFD